MDGIASKCRDRLPDDSLRIFQEMKMYTEYVFPSSKCLTNKYRVENFVFERKSQWITETKPFVIQ